MLTKEDFMNELAAAFRRIQTDVLIKPGDDGPAIPAHKAVLAVRSRVFRDMLDYEECKALFNEAITLSELNYDELDCLLEFLYTGDVLVKKMKLHGVALFRAAHQYEIPYLRELCRSHFVNSLESSNALDILELSSMTTDKPFKEVVLNFIVEHMKEIVDSNDYLAFMMKNPILGVQITRAYVDETKGFSHRCKTSFSSFG